MKAPGKRWMVFIFFCGFMLMGTAAFIFGDVSFVRILEFIENIVGQISS